MWWIIAILVLAILAVITIIFLRLTTLITFLSQQKDPIIIEKDIPYTMTSQPDTPTYSGAGMQRILIEG
jgi:hypothetical protein